MNLSAPFIERPVMTTLLMVALLVAGLICYWRLPISNMPDVAYPVINVRVTYPGTDAETMANSVALPLEKAFMAIPGLRLVNSTNIIGMTNIILQFEIDKEMEIAAQDVQSAISIALPNLPPGLPYGPVYRKANPAEQPIIYIALTSKTLPRSDLYTYANTFLGQRISMVEGVAQVTTYGSPLAIRVQVDPAKLTAYDLTLPEVAKMISLQNVTIPTGQLEGLIEAPLISVNGELTHSSTYDSLILAYRNGTPIRLSDVGHAIESFQNDKVDSRYFDANGGQASVTLAIQKEASGNTVAIAEEIYKLLKVLEKELPAAIEVHIVYDRSIPVHDAIKDANKTLFLALLLVVLVIFLYLGKVADTLIPSVVLPLSVIGTFIAMDLLHFTLDNLSVLALTLSIGFIIDDAIVVLENSVRAVESGDSPHEAALKGSQQVCFTILSMTLSLIAVFIPMLFMGGLIGKLFREFAITLTVVVLISGFLSLTLTPMLCSRFIPPRGQRTATKISYWSERANQALLEKYRTILIAVIDHRKTALMVGLLCLIITGGLFFTLPTDFIPEEDLGFFVIYAQGKEGDSSWHMQENGNKLRELLHNDPSIDAFISINSYSEYQKGLNFVRLKPIGKRPSVQKVIQQLYDKIAQIPGLQVFIKNIPLIDLSIGQESRAAYQFALHSLYADKLYASTRKILEKMKQDPLFQGVNTDLEINTPQIDVTLLRDRASTFEITAADIEKAFLYSYSGNLISIIPTPTDQYSVILELLPVCQRQATTFNDIWLRSPSSNKKVPLSELIQWKEKIATASVGHINQFPSATLSFNLAPGVPLEKALNCMRALTHEVAETDVLGHPVGAAQTFQESIKSSAYLLLLTIFAVYIVLGILYESFIHPITILTTLPPATFGGLITLLVFGLPLSLYSFLGIILLIGIVKKNGIMIVDFALDNIRHKAMNAKDAIIDACMVRLRPIMMTTMAAVFGALPIALGLGANGAARRPLGLVIIGGLLISQLITLFITPILYLTMESLREKVRVE